MKHIQSQNEDNESEINKLKKEINDLKNEKINELKKKY
jgi:hypothetical protein